MRCFDDSCPRPGSVCVDEGGAFTALPLPERLHLLLYLLIQTVQQVRLSTPPHLGARGRWLSHAVSYPAADTAANARRSDVRGAEVSRP